MAEGTLQVPDVVGSTLSKAKETLISLGLTLGAVKNVSSTTVASGNVIKASPAPGTAVSPGSSVGLEVSSGAAQVAVPDVVGLTRPAAETILKNSGLLVGPVKTHHSDSVPDGGISNPNPPAGTVVPTGSKVELELSTGPEPNWTQYIQPALFTALGLTILVFIGYIVTPFGQDFLDKLADAQHARGLITFLIAITTVGIAIILQSQRS